MTQGDLLDRPRPPVAARLKRDARRAGLRRRPAARHRRGAHGRLDGRRGAAPDADHRPGHVLEPQPRRSTGARATPRATRSGSGGRAGLRRRRRCWCGSTRSAPPATPATPHLLRRRRCRPLGAVTGSMTAASTLTRTGPDLALGATWPDLRGVPRAGPRPPRRPGRPAAPRRRRDAGRRLPQARRATGPGRSCWSRPSTAASGPRYSIRRRARATPR